MATYALSAEWRGRKLVNSIFMLGLTVPIHAAILPIFIILRELKMTNSYQALIIPYTAFALAMAIMICQSFIENIPRELEESACIDGCGVYGIFFRIVLRSETGTFYLAFLPFYKRGMNLCLPSSLSVTVNIVHCR